MRPRAGQATVEWVAVATVAAAIALGCAAGAHGLDGADGRLGEALQAAAGAATAVPTPTPPGLGVAALDAVDGTAVVAIARGLAASGIAELPPGSNRGPGVDVFTGGEAEPWCADFVSWVLREAGHPLTGGDEGWRVPGTGTLREWFAARGRFRERLVADPHPGDVVWFRHGHVGIVAAVRGTTLETIEGNADDAVRTRTYRAWRLNPDIGGFGRVPG